MLSDVQPIRTACFSPGGQHIALGTNSKSLKILSVPNVDSEDEDNDTEQPGEENGNDTEQPKEKNGKVDFRMPEKLFSPAYLNFSVDNTSLFLLAEETTLDLIKSKLNEADLLIELFLAKESADTEELYYIMDLLHEVYDLLTRHAGQIDEGDFMQLLDRVIIMIIVVTGLMETS